MSTPLLWVLPKWPIPPEDGARLASFNLIRGLTSLGREIHLLAVAGLGEVIEPAKAKQLLGVSSVSIVRRPETGRGISKAVSLAYSVASRSSVPATMRHFCGRAVRQAVADTIAQHDSPVIVYDGLHPAAHSIFEGRYRRPENVPAVIYRAHNREADLWSRMAAQSGSVMKRAVLSRQAALVRTFEDSLLSCCDIVASVSDEDLRELAPAAASATTGVVPIGYEFGEIPVIQKEVELLFLGRLDWYPNRDGLRWFLSRVWPRVLRRRQDVRLVVAGSGNPGGLRSMLHGARVDFRGRVSEISDLYASASLCLVPVFYGSGTRVKVIEASRFGRPCLSTALGVEGVGLEEGQSYLRAETEAEWVESICSFDVRRGEAVGRNAYRTTEERFGLIQCARRFAELLDSLQVRG